MICFFFFSSRRRHTRFDCDWSSDVCSSDLARATPPLLRAAARRGWRSPTGSGRPPPALLEDLDGDRDHGENDHDDDHDVDVLSDVRNRPAQQVARPGHAGHPSHTADDIVEEEPAVLHLADTGDHRGKGANDGDEARDHDRLGPMARVKATGSLDVAWVEEQRPLAREQARTDPDADGVADAVAPHGGHDQEPVDPPDVETARRSDEPRGNQERIAGQEEADEEPRLGEDDPDQNGGATPPDQVVQGMGPGNDPNRNSTELLLAPRDGADAPGLG